MTFWVYLSYRGLLRALGGFSALMILVALPGLLSRLSLGVVPHATVFYLLLAASGCALIFKGLRPKWLDRPLGLFQGVVVGAVLVLIGFGAGELAGKAVAMSALKSGPAYQMAITLWSVSVALGTVSGIAGIVVSLLRDVSGSRAVFGQSSEGI